MAISPVKNEADVGPAPDQEWRLRKKRTWIRLAIFGGMLAASLGAWALSIDPFIVLPMLLAVISWIVLYGIWRRRRTYSEMEVFSGDMRKLVRHDGERSGTGKIVAYAVASVLFVQAAWDRFRHPVPWKDSIILKLFVGFLLFFIVWEIWGLCREKRKRKGIRGQDA